MKPLLLLLLLSSCSPNYSQYPHQQQAETIVWALYPQVNSSPPSVEWFTKDCPYAQVDLSAVVYEGMCYSGLTLDAEYSMVAWRGSFSSSAFSHELLHANQYDRNIYDPNHLLPEWNVLVPIANSALLSAGL